MDVAQNLRFGYFPRETPRAFTTRDFARMSGVLKATPPTKQWTACTPLNLARPGGTLRRRLGLPNPFSQLELVKLCAANWSPLDAHLRRSTISLSRPVADSTGFLRLRVPYDDRAGERLTRMHRARHTLVADISNFYGSIYTHSLEWALHTKAAAKASAKVKGAPKSLGGLLDEAARCATEGQTKGLPIGPRTSLILSELIVCAIDEQLQAKHGATGRYAIRMIDDFEFSAASRAEAEDVLFTLDSLLSAYELDLNPLKTRILDGPVTPDAPWRTALRQFTLRTDASDRALANDIRGLFSLAFELASSADPGEAVLTYAVSRVAALTFEKTSWEVFSHLLLAAATAEPSSLGHAHRALIAARRADHRIDATLISDALSGICYYHAPLEHGSEVAWSLNILRDLRIPISSDAALRVSTMQDNCSLLLLMDMVASGLVGGSTPSTASVQQRAEEDGAHKSEDWLLAYECVRLGWASDKHFKAHAHWNELLKLGVSFFKAASPRSSLPPPVNTLPALSSTVPSPRSEEEDEGQHTTTAPWDQSPANTTSNGVPDRAEGKGIHASETLASVTRTGAEGEGGSGDTRDADDEEQAANDVVDDDPEGDVPPDVASSYI